MKGHQLALAVAMGLLPVAPAVVQTPGPSAAPTLSIPSVQPDQAKPADPQKPKNVWNTWENKAFSTTLILTFGVDVGGFVQDDANTAQVGHQPTEIKWRAERINLVGQIKFKRPWTYQFGAAFNGLEADDHWTWMDATREWRLEFNYGYITLERGGTTGHAHGLSARIVWNM